MADNFDIVEEALRLLAPKRYKSGGAVKHFDSGGFTSSILGDTPFGSSLAGSLSSNASRDSSDSTAAIVTPGQQSALGNLLANMGGTTNPYGQALAGDSGMSGLPNIVPADVTVGGPMGWGSIGIGALDARLWGMFAPESGSMSSEFSTYIMGLIIERAMAALASNVQWTDAEIGAFQQRIAAEVSGYIDRKDIYDLIAEDPSNPEFVEYVMEKKGELMGIKPELLTLMVNKANAAASGKGVLATAQEKAQAAIDIVNSAMGEAQDFIDDKLSGVHDVVDKLYGKGQEIIDDIWRRVPEPIRNAWPNAGIVYNTTTGSVTGTWEFGNAWPSSVPNGTGGILIGNVNPAGGWITPRRSSPIVITTGSAIKDKLINVLLGKGRIDPATILQEVLAKVVEMTGIPASILQGSPNLMDIVETITRAIRDNVLTANATFKLASGCDNWFQCPEGERPNDDCNGCESISVDPPVDPPVDPALQACLDQGCTGIDDDGNCTGCPLTPLEECQADGCTGIDDDGNCTGCPPTALEECQAQGCTGYNEATDECTGCECPDPCPDPDNQIQASFVDGCGCTDIGCSAEQIAACDELDLEIGTDCNCIPVEGCESVEYYLDHPCECQDGYAAANPGECDPVLPVECTQQQIDDCWTALNTDCSCPELPIAECTQQQIDDCWTALNTDCSCPELPIAECTQQQIDDCWTTLNTDCSCPPLLDPCEELEGECAKLGKCADCNTMQCVECSGGCTAAAQALCPEAQLDANCNCPDAPVEPTTTTTSPRGFFPTALPGSSRRTVTSDPPELVNIDYLYDVGGTSIFPGNIDEFLNPDTEPTSFSSYTPYNRGGIVQDRVIETLVNILRGK